MLNKRGSGQISLLKYSGVIMIVIVLRISVGIICAIISFLMFRKWYYKYPKGERWFDADEDWERPAWTSAYNRYYQRMVMAKWIGYVAIFFVFWGNIPAIVVSVISLHLGFKYILFQKAVWR